MRIRIVLWTVIVSLLWMSGCAKREPATIMVADMKGQATADEKTKEEKVFVYVCGAVKNPGVYELSPDSRVQDAISMAGGFLKRADTTGINLAALVEDEMQLQVPEIQKQGAQGSDKVNLNTADKEQLMTLPGVGESKAESILQYREKNGRFRKIEDIMQINGIKEGLFEKIKDSITV